jgi:hypothetical protein
MHNSNNICIISFCGIFFPANKIASLQLCTPFNSENNFLHLCVNIFSHVVLLTFCVLSVHHSYHFATSLSILRLDGPLPDCFFPQKD